MRLHTHTHARDVEGLGMRLHTHTHSRDGEGFGMRGGGGEGGGQVA